MEKKYVVKVTESLYKACRIMFKGGAGTKEVSEYMGISRTTASFIKNAETYEEYKAIMYAQSGNNHRKPVEKKEEPQKEVVEYRQNVTIQATHYMQKELEKTNELLTLISNKLAFIVDELCGIKKTGAGE